MARRTAPNENPWGHGEAPLVEPTKNGNISFKEAFGVDSKNSKEDLEDFSALAREVTEIRRELSEVKKERDLAVRDLAETRAEAKKHKQGEDYFRAKAEDLDEDNKIGEFGLKQGLENKIRESDATINESFTELLARQAQDALSRPGAETFMKINDRATREVVLEEWKEEGVIPEDIDINELADLPDNERTVALKYLRIGGGFSPEAKLSPRIEETFSKETREQYETPNLISGDPPEGRSNAWESVRSIYVHDIDKKIETIGGVIDETISKIESTYKKRIKTKDREWIREQVKEQIKTDNIYVPDILLPQMGLRGGTIGNLKQGIDTVNLLPVFGNETVMGPIIESARKEVAKKDKGTELNDSKAVVKLLEDILTHAKASKASL